MAQPLPPRLPAAQDPPRRPPAAPPPRPFSLLASRPSPSPPSPHSPPMGMASEPDGALGGGILEPQLEQLSRMLEAVLRDPADLTYVRNDGFAMLSEVLMTEQVGPLADGLAPGALAALQAEDEPPSPVLTAVREVVEAALLPDGRQRFELWDSDASVVDSWIRAVPGDAEAAAAAERSDGEGRGSTKGPAALHGQGGLWQGAWQDSCNGDSQNGRETTRGDDQQIQLGPSPLLQQCLGGEAGAPLEPAALPWQPALPEPAPPAEPAPPPSA
ncbi:unnamed protein product, partial [Prorocentrum cordatum]